MIVNGIKDNDITSFKIVDNIENNKQVVGTFVKNSAELKIINLNHVYDNLYHTYIEIQGFGNWYVEDLKTDEEYLESTLSLFDNTQKFDEPYQDTFSFPSTMGAWATWIGEQVGIPLKGDFLNSKIVLSKRPYIGDNPTWKSAVQIIAKYACGYAQTNYDNTYSIKWFGNTLHEIEDWENFVHGNPKPSINILILSSGDTEDNVKYPEETPSEPHELRIEDDWNYIDRYSINETIYNQVNGFSYTPISKLNVPYGLLDLRAGQKIKSQDIEHIDIETNISKHTLEWQGGDFNDPNSWTSSIEMAELNETVSNYGNANSTLNKLLKVERTTDKNTGDIRDLVQETSQYSERITKVEEDVDGIRQTVDSIYTMTREVSRQGKITLEKTREGPLLKLSIKGYMELLYPDIDLYPDEDLYPLDSYLIIENKEAGNQKIHLPFDHLYSSDDKSDEFIFENVYNEDTAKYETTVKIIRNVKASYKPLEVGTDLSDKFIRFSFPKNYNFSKEAKKTLFETDTYEVAETYNSSLQVGTDLSGATLSLSFPSTLASVNDFQGIIRSEKYAIRKLYSSTDGNRIMLYSNASSSYIATLFDSTQKINLTSYKLPIDFGEVTFISGTDDMSYEFLQYIKLNPIDEISLYRKSTNERISIFYSTKDNIALDGYLLPSDFGPITSIVSGFEAKSCATTNEIVYTNLTKPTEEKLETFEINLKDGDNIIYLESFDNLLLTAVYATQNELTKDFATRIELSTAIKQSETSIDLVARKKVGYNEIISSINQTAEEIKIDASKIELSAANILDIIAGSEINLKTKNISIVSDNFNVNGTTFSWKATNSSMSTDGTLKANDVDLTGKITATSGSFKGDVTTENIIATGGNIAGWEIGKDRFVKGDFYINSNGYTNIYTYADVLMIRNYLLNKISFTDEDIRHYDLNNDGVINSADLLLMRKMILGEDVL